MAGIGDMRITDLKQILWWLAGGLLICTGVLTGVILLQPSKGHAGQFSQWGADQLILARKVDVGRQSAGWDFRKTYDATYSVKIDGIAPPPEPAAETGPEKPVEVKKRPLSDFLDVVALWTDVVFYRLKSRPGELGEVEVGDTIPREQIPDLGGTAKLLRIEFHRSPFRAVFLVHGEEEVFLVAQEGVILAQPAAAAVASEGDYRGPDGLVPPGVREVPPPGIKVTEKGVEISGPTADMFNNEYDSLFKDVAWDSTKQGIAVSAIRKGSRFDLLNREAGGVLRERDVVAKVNGVKVESPAQIVNHFRENPVPRGAPIVVELIRSGQTVTQTFRVPGK
jgi:hypothetical protein